jgi:predicted DNA-binding protein (UPF0251 family)
MRISQQTFSRILKKARSILADAMVNGKIIKIQGGYYIINTDKEASQIHQNIPPNTPRKT